MNITSPGFLLLALIGVLMAVIAWPAAQHQKEAEKDLSAEDLKTFRDHYRRPKDRATMPSRFQPFADAVDRASRLWVFFALTIVVALIWIIVAGPNLGLFDG